MLVLGVDPGTKTGYGIVEERDNRLKAIKWGVISPSSHLSFPKRLKSIKDGLEEIISKYRPDAVAVEGLFYSKNVKAALNLGHTRGAAILAAASMDIDVIEYPPLEVKKSIVGYGRADKEQVKSMIYRLLNLEKGSVPDDASDALAIAICHIHNSGFNRFVKNSHLG